jgi:hypothetical protein
MINCLDKYFTHNGREIIIPLPIKHSSDMESIKIKIYNDIEKDILLKEDFLEDLKLTEKSAIEDKMKGYQYDNQRSNLSINLVGGELFSDDIPDSMFDLYEEVCNGVILLIRKYLPDIKIKFTWTTDGIYTKHERIINLFNNINIKDEKSVIVFNYTPIGRFRTRGQFELFEKTFWYFYNNYTILSKINFIALKSNIDALISGRDKFIINTPNDILINIHHYYNNPKNSDNFTHTFLNMNNIIIEPNDISSSLQPGDEDFYQFYKWIIDNNRYNFNRVSTIIKYVYGIDPPDFFFMCRELLNHISKKELQKKYCIPGIEKRGCLYCEYNDICDEMCWCFVHFNFFEISKCYIKRTIKYLYDHPEVEERYNEYKNQINFEKFIN